MPEAAVRRLIATRYDTGHDVVRRSDRRSSRTARTFRCNKRKRSITSVLLRTDYYTNVVGRARVVLDKICA